MREQPVFSILLGLLDVLSVEDPPREIITKEYWTLWVQVCENVLLDLLDVLSVEDPPRDLSLFLSMENSMSSIIISPLDSMGEECVCGDYPSVGLDGEI